MTEPERINLWQGFFRLLFFAPPALFAYWMMRRNARR
jgi:hypothetical protein